MRTSKTVERIREMSELQMQLGTMYTHWRMRRKINYGPGHRKSVQPSNPFTGLSAYTLGIEPIHREEL